MTDQSIATRPTPTVPETFLLFDRADDDVVLARLRGEILRACVYAFKQGGQMIYGLGIDGAEACKREMARAGEVIEEEDIQIERDEPEAVYVKARASRWGVKPDGRRIKLDAALGVKRQAKFIYRRDGAAEPNPFWWEQAASKAMRNAVLHLVPQELQQRIIDSFKALGNVREVQMDPETHGSMVEEAHSLFPPAAETPEADRPALLKAVRVAQAKIGKQKADLIKTRLEISVDAALESLDLAALQMLRDHFQGAK